MFKFRHLKSKTFLGASLLVAGVCTAVAAPNLEKGELQSVTSKILFSANKIESASNTQSTILKGNVYLLVSNKITISAEKVLVNYTDKNQHNVAEFIIYGKGTLDEGNHSLQFVNGTFNPNNLQLSAEQIVHKS